MNKLLFIFLGFLGMGLVAMEPLATPPGTPKKDASQVAPLKELILIQKIQHALGQEDSEEKITAIIGDYEKLYHQKVIPQELHTSSLQVIERETPDRIRFSRDIKILRKQFHTILQARTTGRDKKPKLENLLMRAKTLQHNYANYLRLNTEPNKQAADFIDKINVQIEKFTGRKYMRKGKTLYKKKLFG